MTQEQVIQKIEYEVKKEYPDITIHKVNIKDMCFEQRVRMNCFYCKNYNLNWKCPPKIPDIDYEKMMNEYDNAAFVKIELPFIEENFQEIRTKSTNDLHKAMLLLEKQLWDMDYSMAISFIGGSCKLCKNGCGKERCNNPYSARVPLEATGVNVIKSAQSVGIKITFPPNETLMRVGLLLW